MATDQPAPTLAQHGPAGEGVVGQEGAVEEDLGEALVAVEPAEAPHGDAVEVERDEQVGEARVALALGVGAEQAEQVGAEGAPGGPRLLAVEHPAAPLVVAPGPAGQRGQVAAGVGLAPPLAPEVVAPGHAAAGRGPAGSAVPYSKTVGARRKMPFWVIRGGAPAR